MLVATVVDKEHLVQCMTKHGVIITVVSTSSSLPISKPTYRTKAFQFGKLIVISILLSRSLIIEQR